MAQVALAKRQRFPDVTLDVNYAWGGYGGFSTNGLVATHLIPYCMDHGIPEVSAASLLAAMGVFDLIGTTMSGWLTDRYNARVLLFWYYGLRGLSLVVLAWLAVAARAAQALRAVLTTST